MTNKERKSTLQFLRKLLFSSASLQERVKTIFSWVSSSETVIKKQLGLLANESSTSVNEIFLISVCNSSFFPGKILIFLKKNERF